MGTTNRIPGERSKNFWPHFVLGSVLLIVAVGFAIWGFSISTLSADQRQILLWVLPLASGFSARAFAGSMSVKAKRFWPGLVITATGGFGVWLLSFFLLFPKPTLTPPGTGELIPRDRGSVTDDLGYGIAFGNDTSIMNFNAPIGGALFPLGSNVPFWISKTRKGLLINAEVKSMDGKVMAELVNNEWRVNPHNYFKLNFDRSSLEIVDDYNIPWLQIEYLTSSSLKIGGIFRGGENINSKKFPNFTNVVSQIQITKVKSGGAVIIGNGRLTMLGGILVETEQQKQAFANEVRDIIEPWFDYAPSKGPGVRLPPEPKVTTNPRTLQIPSSALSGEVGGQPFICSKAMLFGRTLFLSQDDNFPPLTGVTISLPLEWGEPVAGKEFAVTNQNQGERKTSISLSWKTGETLKSDYLAQNFVMLIQFGALTGSQISGMLYLESSRKKQTRIAGNFVADVK